jgi:hypothetical protein
MVKVEHIVTPSSEQWEAIIRGMRNPMNSWDRSDSEFIPWDDVHIGDDDLTLMEKLAAAGSDHRKYMRMTPVYMDITAPLYWWKEFDTYKIGTVVNSCSTMHKIHTKEFTLGDFSHDRLNERGLAVLRFTITNLNQFRDLYNETKDTEWWDQIIQTLPTSYNQKRTVMLNYETLRNIYRARKNHKLMEWREYCKKIEELPYSEIITG